ncbi:MAG: cytochrome c oxidase subunit II, partial [Sulfuricaulis sp.]|nr:cytochrome c oxidase subunit II [Sulfuricaulis sp.]
MFRKLIREFPGSVSRLILGVGLWMAAPVVFAEYGLNFQKPVTSVASKILELHNMILLICVIIFVIVFGVMFYSIFAHRKSRGYKPAKFHDNATLEVVWTVIPFLILVSMAIPSTATLLEMSDTSKSDLTIKITAYQWKWKYDYPDQDVSFFSTLSTPRDQIGSPRFSANGFKPGADKNKEYLLEVDNPIVVPVGKKVRFLVTAND